MTRRRDTVTMAILFELTYQLNKMFIKNPSLVFHKITDLSENSYRIARNTKHKIILRHKNEITEFILPNFRTCYKQELSSQCGVGIEINISIMRNLYGGQEGIVRTGHGTTDWFKIGKGVHQSCIFSPCLFNLNALCMLLLSCFSCV